MDKYRKAGETNLNAKHTHPDLIAKKALVNATFASQQRDQFFDEAYGDILVDYFMAFLKTEPHETKAREFIYSCVLALGDVRKRLVGFETFGKNLTYMEDKRNEDD